MTAPDMSVQDQAFDWLAELNSGEALPTERRVALDAWLHAPEHAAAFAEARALWADLDWAEPLNAAALEASGPKAAIQPGARRDRPARSGAGASRRRGLAVAAALAAGVACVALLGPVAMDQITGLLAVRTLETTTGPGEVRHLVLDDGSRITLGGRSTVRVRLARDEREVELIDGDAFFQVAHDPQRPFTVDAGGLTAVVIGTAFEVNRHAQAAEVSVTEGRVRASADGGTALLTPGVRARASGGAFEVEPFDVTLAGRWRDHRAAFRDAPLGEVVESLNRYHSRGVVLADPALADLPVSAAFPMDQMEAALGALSISHGLTARRDAQGRLVVDGPAEERSPG